MNFTDNNKVVPQLEPTPFESFSDLGLTEKDLENFISDNLFEVLYSRSPLMPIFQERRGQKVGDIYALNESGDLTIFELKRDTAGDDAILQLLTYTQEVRRWKYSFLNDKYGEYLRINDKKEESLEVAHKETFDVELTHEQFNRKQHLIVIGNAADKKLIDIVQYWRNQQGLSINFIPYRVYTFNQEKYFEFFTPPYDQYDDTSEKKGVIIDTNETYSRSGIPDVRYMMENSRIATFGDRKNIIDSINKEDIVFFYHKGCGIVAAGTVNSDRKIDSNMKEETWYRDVDFLTTPPKTFNEIPSMRPARVAEITGQSFFWQGTIKWPILSIDKAKLLVDELEKYLDPN